MSWLDQVNVTELEEQEKEQENFRGFELPESGVYEITIEQIFVDKTQGGTTFFSVIGSQGKFPNNVEINLTGWDVQRMVKNKDGQTKNSKGGYYTGLMLLDKIAKCAGKRVTELIPQKGYVEIFGQQREVGIFKDLLGKKVVIGIRHRKYEKQDSSEGTALQLVDVCCTGNEECKEKLIKRIEKRPIVEERSNNQPSNSQTSTDDIQF